MDKSNILLLNVTKKKRSIKLKIDRLKQNPNGFFLLIQNYVDFDYISFSNPELGAKNRKSKETDRKKTRKIERERD